MGELKPIGSEKLKGDAKLRRILELTYYNSIDNSAKSSEVIKESSTGVYGIVKEKDGYYIKRGLNEESLDYIGGLFMKNKNRCSSYGEALKKLEFLTEQENLQEATKYILKRPASMPKPAEQATEAPAPMPTNEPPAPAATPDPTATAPDAGLTPGADDSLGSDKDTENTPDAPEDPIKIIQTKTGRLTQKLNQYKDDLESEDMKYVLGMVMSAMDLDKMEEKDKDEMLNKLEGDDETGDEPQDEAVPNDMAKQTAEDSGGMGSSQVGGIGSGETDDENGGIDPMNSLEELITHPFEDDDTYNPDDEDGDYGIGPDDVLNDPHSKKASYAAQHDIAKDIEGMDNEDPDEYIADFDSKHKHDEDDNDSEEEVAEFMSGESANPSGEKDNVKELDIDELTNSFRETLSKYFSE